MDSQASDGGNGAGKWEGKKKEKKRLARKIGTVDGKGDVTQKTTSGIIQSPYFLDLPRNVQTQKTKPFYATPMARKKDEYYSTRNKLAAVLKCPKNEVKRKNRRNLTIERCKSVESTSTYRPLLFPEVPTTFA
jgi:hypothetical protein